MVFLAQLQQLNSALLLLEFCPFVFPSVYRTHISCYETNKPTADILIMKGQFHVCFTYLLYIVVVTRRQRSDTLRRVFVIHCESKKYATLHSCVTLAYVDRY